VNGPSVPMPLQKARLLVLTVCHFAVDSYATMLAPILPLIVQRQGLSNAAAGLLGTVVASIGMSQPLLGLWADRLRPRPFVIAGAFLAAVFTPLLGVAPGYGTTVLALALGGVGVAAFHPPGFALAGELSGTRRALGLALFAFGGTLALGVTPLWLSRFASTHGLERLPWLSVPGILLLLLAGRALPPQPRRGGAPSASLLLAALAPQARLLLLVTAIVALRSVTSISFGTFLAVLEHERGAPAAEAGRLALSVYLTAGVIGSLVAAYLADRMDPKPLIWGGLLLAAPLLWAYLRVPSGWPAYGLLALGGAMVLSSNSVLVSIVQEAAPRHMSLVSSLPQGFAWGLAGMALPLIGHLADRAGMAATLGYVAWLPVLPAVLAAFLPSRPRDQAAGMAAPRAT